MHDVFISYSRDDQYAAQVIADRLTQAGFSVFFDREGIVAGDSWSDRMGEELQGAHAVLALLSSNSRRSSWVQSELQTALDSKKLVIPVLLDERAKENWLWPLLATRQSVELDPASPAAEAQLGQLVDALSATLGGSRERRPALSRAAPRASSASSSFWRTLLVALVSATIGALATWLLWR